MIFSEEKVIDEWVHAYKSQEEASTSRMPDDARYSAYRLLLGRCKLPLLKSWHGGQKIVMWRWIVLDLKFILEARGLLF